MKMSRNSSHLVKLIDDDDDVMSADHAADQLLLNSCINAIHEQDSDDDDDPCQEEEGNNKKEFAHTPNRSIRKKQKKGPSYVPSYMVEGTSCVVCGDAATGFHYKAMTCEGCKGFFRRSHHRDLVKTYRCRHDGTCVINIATRHECQYCRYQKCIAMRMRPEMVMSASARAEKRRLVAKNREKKLLQERQKLHTNNDGNITSTQPLTILEPSSHAMARLVDNNNEKTFVPFNNNHQHHQHQHQHHHHQHHNSSSSLVQQQGWKENRPIQESILTTTTNTNDPASDASHHRYPQCIMKVENQNKMLPRARLNEEDEKFVERVYCSFLLRHEPLPEEEKIHLIEMDLLLERVTFYQMVTMLLKNDSVEVANVGNVEKKSPKQYTALREILRPMVEAVYRFIQRIPIFSKFQNEDKRIMLLASFMETTLINMLRQYDEEEGALFLNSDEVITPTRVRDSKCPRDLRCLYRTAEEMNRLCLDDRYFALMLCQVIVEADRLLVKDYLALRITQIHTIQILKRYAASFFYSVGGSDEAASEAQSKAFFDHWTSTLMLITTVRRLALKCPTRCLSRKMEKIIEKLTERLFEISSLNDLQVDGPLLPESLLEVGDSNSSFTGETVFYSNE